MKPNDLCGIPDYAEIGPDALAAWVERAVEEARDLTFTPELAENFYCVDLTEVADHPFGPEGDPHWRKFFLASLVADWICYDGPIDRIDYSRLKYIMSSAYRSVHVWCCRMPDGRAVPVGYSAWYPISRFVFEAVEGNTAEINDRGFFLPLRDVKPDEIEFAYVLNIGIAKGLRNTVCSRRMIRALQRDGVKHGKMGVMAVTVDAAGQKFSRLASLKKIGDIKVQGETEALFKGFLV